MPWKLIGFIILVGLILLFITLNVGNKSDISFGVVVFKNVHIFTSLFVAFLIGLLTALAVTLMGRGKVKKRVVEKITSRIKKEEQKKNNASKKKLKHDSKKEVRKKSKEPEHEKD